MVEFPKIPTKIYFSGDVDKARDLIGFGKKRYADLVTAMGFQGLQTGFNTLKMSDGTIIKTTQSYGLSTIEIYVPVIVPVVEEPKSYPGGELRFFARVGSAEDVVLDELTGEVLEDYTKYYWIDFYAGKQLNEIKFYRQGELIVDKENDQNFQYAPSVSRIILLSVADPPRYMDDVSVKAFDLEYTDNGALKKQRFVMGYHYLTQNRFIKYYVEQNLLPMPDACVYDFNYGVTKCPVNRLFYDIESQTLAWYHVAQEWMDLADGVPNEYAESTGAIGALIGELEYKYDQVSQKTQWIFKRNKSFKLSGAKAKIDYGFSDGPWTNVVNEPVCIIADIISLDRDEVVVHCAFQAQLFEFTYDLNTNTFESCEEIATSQTNVLVSDGFELINSAEWENVTGTAVTDPQSKTDSYGAKDCSWSIYDDCVANGGYKMTEAYMTWDRRYNSSRSLSHTGIFIPLGESSPYMFEKTNRGMNAGSEEESIQNSGGFCRWNVPGDYCYVNNYSGDTYKKIEGFLTGSFGTKVFATVPAQNITRTETISKIVYDIDMMRKINITPTSSRNLIDNQALLNDSVDDFCDVCNFITPNYDHNTNSSGHVFTTEWYVNYQYRDPIDIIDPNGAYPFSYPAMSYGDVGDNYYWYHEMYDYSNTENETLNEVEVYGISGTFDRNTFTNVSFLDDRGTEESHGHVVFLKAENNIESKIYHGDNTLENKTQSFMNALELQGLIDADEFIYAIGLL